MIRIENVVTPSPAQWERIIMGMRNPKNSWDKSDSYTTHIEDPETLQTADFEFFVGENDLKLMQQLSHAGRDHRKYIRMIPIYMDITAPMFWWKEFDTYKVGTVKNSCSTMHKIHVKEFTYDDFTHEGIDEVTKVFPLLKIQFEEYIETLEWLRVRFNETQDKKYWRALIEMLPSNYNMRATVFLDYEVLANMYHARKNHPLDEWKVLCERIEDLPYSEVITGKPIVTDKKCDIPNQEV